jgi:hypothetical protein
MISHATEVSSALYISSTSGNGVSAGLLTFVQYGSVYDGTSSTAPLLARSSTANVGGQEYTSPISFGPNGMYVVPATSGTTSALVHFK